jgi:hypothetical protein
MAESRGLDVDKDINRMACDTQQGLADLQLLKPTENNSLSLTIHTPNSFRWTRGRRG